MLGCGASRDAGRKVVNPLELEDIPGLLFRGYGGHRFATFLMFRVRERAAARAWLGGLLRDTALHFGPERPGEHALLAAFTRTGLEKLGVAKSFIETFAPAFLEGMTSAHRARILGDVESNAPEHWVWGRGDDPVDVALALYSTGSDAHRRRVAEETGRAGTSGLELHTALPATPMPEPAPGVNLREHFGFADGISQPVWEGSGLEAGLSERERMLHQVPAGEFVMGQENAYGVVTPVPQIREGRDAFGHGGSYLVLRQLSQDVTAFWNYFDVKAGSEMTPGAVSPATRLAAKAVGRWPDGSPLATCPHAPDPAQGRRNDFLYADFDRDGLRCPVGAHVRRGYPRDSKEEDRDAAIQHANTHRILRRGRSYGKPIENPREADAEARGLLFLCLNANLERQFEFVQQSWVGNAAFDGLQGERDPLIGTRSSEAAYFSIPGTPARERLEGIPQFVRVRGGAYFFAPGRKGLTQLAELTDSSP
jgi:Dyp-type peroxidase family